MIRGDTPITSRDEDRLDRGLLADQIAAAIRAAPAPDGLVVGLLGAQGVGKTSLLNMIIEQLGAAPTRIVLQFDPWLLPGDGKIVNGFFEEMAAQLRHLVPPERHLADRFQKYGRAVTTSSLPLGGAEPDRRGRRSSALARALTRSRDVDPIMAQRRRIEEAMEALPEPMIVVLDDIDRLTPRELREAERLVWSTGRFPKLIYLLAFDGAAVGETLSDSPGQRHSCPDGFVESRYEVPAVPQTALGRLLIEGIQELTSDMPVAPVDSPRWTEVFHGVLRPLFRTPRDVTRYLLALPVTLATIGDGVETVDLVTLEALRLRLPDVFARLSVLSGSPTDIRGDSGDPTSHGNEVRTLLARAGVNRPVVEHVCRLLFPATQRYLGGRQYGPEDGVHWERERRVASPAVLAFYLNRVASPGVVPASVVDLAFDALTDRAALQKILDGLLPEDVEELFLRMDASDRELPPDAVEPACTVLLESYSRLRKRSAGLVDPGPELAIGRLVSRLLQRLADPDDRRSAVEWLSQTVRSLTGRLRLLQVADEHPDAGCERLVPVADLDRLYRQICRDIRHADAHRLLAEHYPLDLLVTALTEDPADRGDVEKLLEDPGFVARLIEEAATEIPSRPGTSGATHADALAWQALLTVLGDEAAIARVVERLAASRGSGDRPPPEIELVQRFLAAWRSSRPFYRPPLVARPATNGPGSGLSPALLGNASPDLQVRAVTAYSVDPTPEGGATLEDQELHRRLAADLADAPLARRMSMLALARGIAARPEQWEPDPDSFQHAKAASYRVILADHGYQSPTWLRYTVRLPDQSEPVRFVVDACLSRPATQSRPWLRLSLQETRELLAACLEAADGAIATALLPMIFPNRTCRRSSLETYISTTPVASTDETQTTIGEMIDLEPLGSSSRSSAPVQGAFAIDGTITLRSPSDFEYLTGQALLRMARDWGYLDTPRDLEGLVS